MNQFVHVLLLGIWLVGSLVMGLDEQPSEPIQREGSFQSTTVPSTASARLVDLSVGTNEIVVTVDTTGASQWQVIVPVPRVVAAWVRQFLPSNPDVPHKSDAPDIACTRPIHTLPNAPRS